MAYSGEGNLIEGQIEGDPNRTVIPVAVDSAGHLIIDIDASSITIGSVDLNDGAGNPISSTGGSLNTNITNFPGTQPVSGIVAVSNFPVTQDVIVENVLVPSVFDYIAMSPTGTNPTTIVYKTGGAGGTTVATLTLTYDANNNVQTLTKT